jgi:hypothetical protein
MRFACGLFLGLSIAYRDAGPEWEGPAVVSMLIAFGILLAVLAVERR